MAQMKGLREDPRPVWGNAVVLHRDRGKPGDEHDANPGLARRHPPGQLDPVDPRHHHIGQGNIGLEGFRALLRYEPFAHCAFVLETPGEEMLEGLENLNTLRALA